jgi:hypothetical protein
MVRALLGDRLHLRLDGGQRLLRRPDVDERPVRPLFVCRWMRKPRKSNPSSMWAVIVFSPTDAGPS